MDVMLAAAGTRFSYACEIPLGRTVAEVRQWCLLNLGPSTTWSIDFNVRSQALRHGGPVWTDDYVPYVLTSTHGQHIQVLLAWR